MSLKNKLIISLVSLAACTTASAEKAYVGAELATNWNNYASNFNRVLDRNSTSLNAFGGLKFNDFFGVEAGVEASFKANKKGATVRAGQSGPYATAVSGGDRFNTSIRSTSPYIGVTGEVPVASNVSVFGLAGAAYSTVDAQVTQVTAAGTTLTSPIVRTYKDNKVIPVAKLGAKYKITDNVGLRATLNWKNTSRFNMTAKENSGVTKLHLGDTFGVGAGIYFAV